LSDVRNAIYYIERDNIISRPRRWAVFKWKMALFSFMFRNAAHAIDRFRIPSNALVEIGRRIEL